MKSLKVARFPTDEFMKFHRELREANERVLSFELDPQTASDVAALRAKENQEVGK